MTVTQLIAKYTKTMRGESWRRGRYFVAWSKHFGCTFFKLEHYYHHAIMHV